MAKWRFGLKCIFMSCSKHQSAFPWPTRIIWVAVPNIWGSGRIKSIAIKVWMKPHLQLSCDRAEQYYGSKNSIYDIANMFILGSNIISMLQTVRFSLKQFPWRDGINNEHYGWLLFSHSSVKGIVALRPAAMPQLIYQHCYMVNIIWKKNWKEHEHRTYSEWEHHPKDLGFFIL